MGPEEAAQAACLLACKAAIPIHYKTFDVLTGTLEEFRNACRPRGIEVIELKPGEILKF
ncbi:MAG: hypothetical protein GYA55_02160 [SAR324 cluster bacterium]|uniref:Metal-dependent hydrolase n=1 Tax=SAR324 cluster bacterium TaxID=2024889 RepID=A0A7X9FPL4_9DELT|nr:hypothetical protein [SAR324 cluster bacterium]